VLDSQKQTANGSHISYIDLSQGKRAIVGLTSGAHANDSAELSHTSPVAVSDKTSDRESLGADRARSSADMGRLIESKTKKRPGDKPSASEKKQDKSKKTEHRKR
jgi:hypothetical protein